MSGAARRSFRAVLTASVARGELGWVFRAVRRSLRLRLGLPLPGPLFVTLAVTYRCNYRCFMCDFPLRAAEEPSLEELVRRIHAVAERGALAVGLTGGEPTLRGDLLEIVAAARQRGLLVHLNTNGSRVDARLARELAAAGVHSVNLSLDGARAATHDRLRRRAGSFEEVVAAVRHLRAAGAQRPRIGLVMVVSRGNREEVASFTELGAELGVDAVSFLPHHDFVAQEDPWTPQEAEELRFSLEAVSLAADNSAAYLAGIPPFLAGAPAPVHCSAPRSHVAIDPEGLAYPCVPFMTLRRDGIPWASRLGRGRPRLAPDEPRDAAEGPRSAAEICRRCWWNCHRELDLGLGVLHTAPSGSGASLSSLPSPT